MTKTEQFRTIDTIIYTWARILTYDLCFGMFVYYTSVFVCNCSPPIVNSISGLILRLDMLSPISHRRDHLIKQPFKLYLFDLSTIEFLRMTNWPWLSYIYQMQILFLRSDAIRISQTAKVFSYLSPHARIV